jgi:DNA polymerase-3 subunit epsilon
MYILGLDFETTGLAESQDIVTEIGAVIWDWEAKRPVLISNELVKIPEGVRLNKVVVEMNGITEDLLGKFGEEPVEAFKKLNEFGKKADYVMAHNADFDRRFYSSSITRCKLEDELSRKLWIDSSTDVEYPFRIKTRRLVFLAAEHNFLCPYAHRAVFDVLTMFKVVQDYDINEIVRSAAEQKYELVADVLFEDKNRAKERGFSWDSTQRLWVKTVKESKLKGESENCGFRLLMRKKGGSEGYAEYPNNSSKSKKSR